MKIDWKRPKPEHIPSLQKFFFEHGLGTSDEQDSAGDFVSPDTSYVYATELDVALALGHDPKMFDNDEKISPLTEYWGPSAGIFHPVIPKELKLSIFPRYLEDEGHCVFVDEAILDWNPDC